MVSKVIAVEDFDLVVFGATGDLARRKLFPALAHRCAAGQIPPDARIIGAAREKLDDAAFKARIAEGLGPEARRRFLDRLSYLAVDAEGPEGWDALAADLRPDVVRVFYFAVAPALFAPLAARLRETGLSGHGARIVVEKPFGHDGASARALNGALGAAFPEESIFRIDHYLGKETVQNLMAIRFANALFEPVWNAQHVDHVQITVAEDAGVAGRGGFYDATGAMRDMVQNHLMQLLCLTAMEPPARFEADAVRDEKLKVIRALDPVVQADIVRGQYARGAGQASYLEDAGVATSTTETYLALRAHVSNWRWSGVPFYLRTGKRLSARISEIAVAFKDPPHLIFPGQMPRRGNVLAIRLQPDEGITLHMTIKDPGPGGMRLAEVPLDMTFAEALAPGLRLPDAYERLVMDVVRGNQTLFMRADEVAAAWDWVDPIIAGWQAGGITRAPALYEAGGGGPEEANSLLRRDGRRWRALEAP